MHHGAKEIARIREESIPVGTFVLLKKIIKTS